MARQTEPGHQGWKEFLMEIRELNEAEMGAISGGDYFDGYDDTMRNASTATDL